MSAPREPARLVITGNSGPLLRVLHACRELEGLCWVSLFTDSPPGPPLEELVRGLGMGIESLRVLSDPQGGRRLRACAPDWLLNIGTSFLFSKSFLSIPKKGALNLHPGRLPDYAGVLAPQWAIRNHETRFAATVNWISWPVSSGAVAYERPVELTADDTGLSATVKCLNAGADLMVDAIRDIAAGRTPPKKAQDLSRRHLYRLEDAKDGAIDWSWDARRIADFVRAADFRPFPSPSYVAKAKLKGKRLTVLRAVVEGSYKGTPGTVADVGPRGMFVVAGDGKSLLVTVVKRSDGTILTGPAIAAELGIGAGDRLH